MRDTVKVLEQDGQTEASALVRNSRRLAIRSESTYIATFFSLILNEGHVKLCKTFCVRMLEYRSVFTQIADI